MSKHQLRPEQGPGVVLHVTPETAGWDVLDFTVLRLDQGEHHLEYTSGREVAFLPLAGSATVIVDGRSYSLQRSGVFDQMPQVLYVPPGYPVEIRALDEAEIAFGGAPAGGRYPVRLIAPEEMKIELRGGGGATRQVNHILTHPLPAERLILYEVYVPRGGWSGWPPHCHDGYEGSPYLEETYYFRFDPDDGFGFHRNYRLDRDFDEVFVVHDRDLVLVTEGFHTSATAPGSHLYFLNFLAGELIDEERGIPPFFQPEYRWIEGNWDRDAMVLPTVGPEA
jgi:5-deoxy-glucuronate isomerase